MPNQTIILITGANRGIGRSLLTTYLSRTHTTVIAAVRSPVETIALFSSIPKHPSSNLHIIEINSTVPASATTALTSLASSYGITKLDLVIANAGIADYYGSAAITPISELQNHLAVNTVGVLALFQACSPFLQEASKEAGNGKGNGKPKFVVLSTSVASITGADTMPLKASAYGASKAAVNYIVRKIHAENEWLIAFPISPGWVQTDMGNAAAVTVGQDAAPTTLEESVGGIISVIDSSTREETSGEFMSFDRKPTLW